MNGMEPSTIVSLSSAAFRYPVRVQPHHTDYAGVVWHGTYIAWMEEARVECLRTVGANYADWVEQGVDLPVIDLTLQYQRPLSLGMEAVVVTGLAPRRGVRLIWEYDIQDRATGATCVRGRVTLAPVDRQNRKIRRQLPPSIATVLDQLYEQFGL